MTATSVPNLTVDTDPTVIVRDIAGRELSCHLEHRI